MLDQYLQNFRLVSHATVSTDLLNIVKVLSKYLQTVNNIPWEKVERIAQFAEQVESIGELCGTVAQQVERRQRQIDVPALQSLISKDLPELSKHLPSILKGEFRGIKLKLPPGGNAMRATANIFKDAKSFCSKLYVAMQGRFLKGSWQLRKKLQMAEALDLRKMWKAGDAGPSNNEQPSLLHLASWCRDNGVNLPDDQQLWEQHQTLNQRLMEASSEHQYQGWHKAKSGACPPTCTLAHCTLL